jgi:hypothetical protein
LHEAGADVSLCLTDKFPNTDALAKVAAAMPRVRFEAESVSATDVPQRLTGFRTVFTAFHHFRPADARAILAAAVRDRQGIAISEPIFRTPAALAMMLLVPLAVWLRTPAIRPFRWSRLFWTYVVPVVPIAVLFDGMVSCLRMYTPDEMAAMAREVESETYDWEAGVEYHRFPFRTSSGFRAVPTRDRRTRRCTGPAGHDGFPGFAAPRALPAGERYTHRATSCRRVDAPRKLPNFVVPPQLPGHLLSISVAL